MKSTSEGVKKHKPFKGSARYMSYTYKTPTLVRHLSIHIKYIEEMCWILRIQNLACQAIFAFKKSHRDCLLNTIESYIV